MNHLADTALRHRRSNIRASLRSVLLLFLAADGNSQAETRWISSWAASQQLPERHNSLASEDLREALPSRSAVANLPSIAASRAAEPWRRAPRRPGACAN